MLNGKKYDQVDEVDEVDEDETQIIQTLQKKIIRQQKLQNSHLKTAATHKILSQMEKIRSKLQRMTKIQKTQATVRNPLNDKIIQMNFNKHMNLQRKMELQLCRQFKKPKCIHLLQE